VKTNKKLTEVMHIKKDCTIDINEAIDCIAKNIENIEDADTFFELKALITTLRSFQEMGFRRIIKDQ
jgi:hypothetical protein